MGNALQMIQRTKRWIPDNQVVFFEKILKLVVVGAAVSAAQYYEEGRCNCINNLQTSERDGLFLSEIRANLKRFITKGPT